MPRNFGLRQAADRFWNENETESKETTFAWFVIGGSVVVVLAVAIFVA